jgi:hypothetical protein
VPKHEACVSHSTIPRFERAGRDRHARTDPCPNRPHDKEKHASGSSGDLLPPSPAAETAATRQDHTGQSGTANGAGEQSTYEAALKATGPRESNIPQGRAIFWRRE